jgi:Flp pilus assembly protein CpaB
LWAGKPLPVSGADTKTETVDVLVAKAEIPVGTLVREPQQLFKIVRYVKGDEPKNAVKDLGRLKNKYLQRSLAEDQPVKETDIADKPPVAVRAGYRAFAVAVDLEKAAGGRVVPGSRVDVLFIDAENKKEAIAKPLLANRIVLALHSVPKADGKPASPSAVVTLEVTPIKVEKLAKARHTGILKLSLRAPGDDPKPVTPKP